jgi:hypothetical protein
MVCPQCSARRMRSPAEAFPSYDADLWDIFVLRRNINAGSSDSACLVLKLSFTCEPSLLVDTSNDLPCAKIRNIKGSFKLRRYFRNKEENLHGLHADVQIWIVLRSHHDTVGGGHRSESSCAYALGFSITNRGLLRPRSHLYHGIWNESAGLRTSLNQTWLTTTLCILLQPVWEAEV